MCSSDLTLWTLLRAEFLIDAVGLNKVQGQPFKVGEVVAEIHKQLEAAPMAQATTTQPTANA